MVCEQIEMAFKNKDFHTWFQYYFILFDVMFSFLDMSSGKVMIDSHQTKSLKERFKKKIVEFST